MQRIVKCNEEVNTEEVIGEKEIKVSDVDKDAGMLCKSDKEKMFGYNASVICQNNNYILTVNTDGSNIHDSVSFYDSSQNLINYFNTISIKYFVGDAAYLTSHICKMIVDLEMILTFPYKEKDIEKVILKI